MKRLRYMRHAKYDKKTGSVPQSELDRILRITNKNGYSDVFYGPMIRTMETAFAITATTLSYVRVHEEIPEIGDNKRINNCLKILSENLNKKALNKFRFYATEALLEMFSQMDNSGRQFGLAVGHGSTIELATLSIGNKKIQPLKHLEYVDFIQDDDGYITIV